VTPRSSSAYNECRGEPDEIGTRLRHYEIVDHLGKGGMGEVFVEHDGDVHFITMELVEGEPLSRRILPDGLSIADLLAIAVPLADAEAFTRAVLDAEIAAVRGDDDRAMILLREAVDAGWVVSWWWELGHNQNLASLHDRDDYRSLVEELESKMARQRATLD